MTAEQQEILEGNKLIADFEGKSVCPVEGTKEFKNWKGKRCDYSHFELKYHSSWDWLMPIVEKIKEKGYLMTLESLRYGEYRMFFNHPDLFEFGGGARDYDMKKCVYKCVLDAIQNINKLNNPAN